MGTMRLQRHKSPVFTHHKRARGFTLLETMLALVIIGIGVLAFVDAQTAFTRSNNWSSRAATGMLLANEIREMSRQYARHDPVTGLTLVGSGTSAVVVGWGREGGETDVSDFDDLDDLDGVTFGVGGTFEGPVNAFGELVQEIDPTGGIVISENGDARGLEGWMQTVTVQKIDPYNFGLARGQGYEQVGTSQLPFLRVDQFPLRVTVVVTYQGPADPQAEEITRMTWVVVP